MLAARRAAAARPADLVPGPQGGGALREGGRARPPPGPARGGGARRRQRKEIFRLESGERLGLRPRARDPAESAGASSPAPPSASRPASRPGWGTSRAASTASDDLPGLRRSTRRASNGVRALGYVRVREAPVFRYRCSRAHASSPIFLSPTASSSSGARRTSRSSPRLRTLLDEDDPADEPRAAYLGASNGDAPEFYDLFVRRHGRHRHPRHCRHDPLASPRARTSRSSTRRT